MFSQESLLSILRFALWGKTETVPQTIASLSVSVLMEAKKQTVAVLAFEAMDKYGVKLPTEVVLNYYSYSAQVEHDNLKLNVAAKALGRLLSKNNINYAIVKGQVVGSLYPNPLLRQPGDIDFYCDNKNFEKAKEVLQKSWGVVLDPKGSDHHVHFDYKRVTFEMHFSLTSFYNKQKNEYWEQLLREDKGSEVVIDGQSVQTLSPTLHTLYVFLHLYHHLMELGVGLRQFCDLAVMLHAYKDVIDHSSLRQHLKALDMEKAFRACGSIVVHQLGLPAEEFPFPLTDRDEHYGKKILSIVFYRGNMGHYNKKSGFHGWKHNIESTGIKVSHFFKFMPLAPGYNCGWLAHELSRKIALKLKS